MHRDEKNCTLLGTEKCVYVCMYVMRDRKENEPRLCRAGLWPRQWSEIQSISVENIFPSRCEADSHNPALPRSPRRTVAHSYCTTDPLWDHRRFCRRS